MPRDYYYIDEVGGLNGILDWIFGSLVRTEEETAEMERTKRAKIWAIAFVIVAGLYFWFNRKK